MASELRDLQQLYNLPSEIWERIIRILVCNPRSLLAASEVCVLWRHLARRVCQIYCARNLDYRLLTELRDVEATHQDFMTENDIESTNDWIETFRLFRETFINAASNDHMILRTFETTICVNSADPYLLISTYDKSRNTSTIYVIRSFDFIRNENSNNKINIQDQILKKLNQLFTIYVNGKVVKTCFLNLPKPVLLIITSTDTSASILPNQNLYSRYIDTISTNPSLKCHPKTCSEGSYFVTEDSENGDYLLLYNSSVSSSSAQTLNVSLTHRLKTESPCYTWILSRSLIHTMETSGHIRAYKVTYKQSTKIGQRKEGINSRDKEEFAIMKEQRYIEKTSLYAESLLKKDLRYPNPTVLTKDFIFSSTIVSRDLLGYWHMDRDRDYWMIGNAPRLRVSDNNEIERDSGPNRISLHNVNLAQETNLTVTSLHFDRGILLCGTKEGHLLGYKMPTANEESKEGSFDSLRSLPWVSIPGVSTQSICKLGSLFTPSGLFVSVGDEAGKCSLVYLACDN